MVKFFIGVLSWNSRHDRRTYTRVSPSLACLAVSSKPSVPNLEPRPNFRQRLLQPIANQDRVVLFAHAIIRIELRSQLHRLAPPLHVLQIVMQKNQTLARVLPRPPKIIILVRADGLRQSHARPEEVDRAGIPISPR